MTQPADTDPLPGLADITALQWRTGAAAWLGWLFDGLDGTLYTLVAAPFVAQLLHAAHPSNPSVGRTGSWIQAAFLVGWALGGALFGRIGDRLGRARTLSFSILTYALFTGLSALSQTWWQLLIFRFVAALGIGGEWAAGASLVAETWPRHWRPWLSALLQSAYQCGYFLAAVTLLFLAASPRYVFLVGAVPALLVFWIRRAIPEPEEWTAAARQSQESGPGIGALFTGATLRTTVLTMLVCSAALTTVWALIFWGPQQLRNLPDIASWPARAKDSYVAQASGLATLVAIGGNFFAALLARRLGYRFAAALMFAGGLVTMIGAYGTPHDHIAMLYWLPCAHFFVQGIFGLFPLYIPPLFPTLLRATGAGFCYNIGRIVAAGGTVFFGLLSRVGDYRGALLCVGYVYIPAIAVALLIPEPGNG